MTEYDHERRLVEVNRIERRFPKLEVFRLIDERQLPPLYLIVSKRGERRFYWIGPSFECMDDLSAEFETSQEALDSCLIHIDRATQDESEDTQQ